MTEFRWNPVNPLDCTEDHPPIAGPNMDMGQCGQCWMPVGVMRPEGETFGWHVDDCALPLRHPGLCAHGGEGHAIPEGVRIRGYFGPDSAGPATT